MLVLCITGTAKSGLAGVSNRAIDVTEHVHTPRLRLGTARWAESILWNLMHCKHQVAMMSCKFVQGGGLLQTYGTSHSNGAIPNVNEEISLAQLMLQGKHGSTCPNAT